MRHKAVACAVDVGTADTSHFTVLRQGGITTDFLEQYDLDQGAFLPTDESRLYGMGCTYFDRTNQLVTPEIIQQEFIRRAIPEAVRARYAMLLNEIRERGEVKPGDLPYIVSRLKNYRAHHSTANVLLAGAQLLRAGDIMGALNLIQHQSGELLVSQTNAEPTQTYADVADNRLKQYAERAISPHIARGVPTGFYKFDSTVGGLYPGDLLVISGLPKEGKSVMLMTIAKRMSEHGNSVVFASGEMTTERVWERFDAMYTNLLTRAIRFGQLNDDDRAIYEKFLAEAKTMRGQIAVIPPDRSAYLDSVEAEIRALQMRQPVQCLIADYIQIIEPSVNGNRGEQDWQKIGRVAVEMARLGHRFGIPVVTASQVPEEYAKRTEDVYLGLARAKSIGHTAASVWRVWRDKIIPDRIWVRVGQSRHGEGGFDFPLRSDFGRMQLIEEDVSTPGTEALEL